MIAASGSGRKVRLSYGVASVIRFHRVPLTYPRRFATYLLFQFPLYVPPSITDVGRKTMTFFSSVLATEPFLLRFATPRSNDAEMPGHYSSQLGIWVVEGDEGEVPIIEVAGGSLVATQSKTMTRVEVDDDDPTRFGQMETGTFTRVRQEADDEDASLRLPELTTKTDVQQEQDDEAVAPYW